MRHTENFTVKFHETDLNRKLSPSKAMMLMQECANMQMEKYGPSLKSLREQGLIFLVSRQIMNYHLPVYEYDNITVQAWTYHSRGYTFRRNLQILKDGQLAADASSLWALYDENEKKLVRVDSLVYNFEHDEQIFPDPPQRIKPTAEFVSVGKRKIVYSDVDYNGHMNNTKYPDMLCDFISGIENMTVKGCYVYYVHEAPLGETLDIHISHAENDNTYYFRTIKEDGQLNVEAFVTVQ